MSKESDFRTEVFDSPKQVECYYKGELVGLCDVYILDGKVKKVWNSLTLVRAENHGIKKEVKRRINQKIKSL